MNNYQKEQKLYNMLSTCQGVNQTKCEYCRHQCKEYKEYLKLKEQREHAKEQNNISR